MDSNHFHFEDQVFLVAANSYAACVLGCKGEYAVETLKINTHPDDIGLDGFEGLPGPGIFLWTGEVNGNCQYWCGSEMMDADERWTGEWRPATLADLREFGFFREDGA